MKENKLAVTRTKFTAGSRIGFAIRYIISRRSYFGYVIRCICNRFIGFRAICSIIALYLYALNMPSFAQTTFNSKVDSFKQTYLNMEMDKDLAETRARTILESQLFTGSIPKVENLTSATNPNSIEVNRNTTYRAYTPTQLIDSIFVKGGISSSVSNVTLRTHGWNGTEWTSQDNRGLGYFSKGNSNFEMTEGLVLSTGGLVSIEGPNSGALVVEPPIGTLAFGDTDLSGLVGNRLRNVTVLAFDFVPTGNVISFRYVFASEEYSIFSNSTYNDVFGFFISGPGISGNQNIALLPTTNTASNIVSINNVNVGKATFNSTFNCPPFQLPHNNSQYYLNIPGSSWAFGGLGCVSRALTTEEDKHYRSMEFNGRTVVLTATYNVSPCSKYSLKLAIGNVTDEQYQSGVFLEARSFNSGEIIVNYGSGNRDQDFVYRGCETNKFEISRPTVDPTPLTVLLQYDDGNAFFEGDITSPDGTPLPTSVTIPANELSVDVPYIVNTNGTGHTTFTIFSSYACNPKVGTTKEIDVYDPSVFQAVATVTCPALNNGTISVSATGGTGNYESSIDGGATWLPTTTVHTKLAPGLYTVYMRDIGSCGGTWVDTIVSTFYTSTVFGSIDICQLSPLTALPSGVSYQWYRNNTLIEGANDQTYLPTSTGNYHVLVYNGTCWSKTSDTISVILLPDVYPVASIIAEMVDDSLKITLDVVNGGVAAIGSPIYVSLYRETLSPQSFTYAERIAVDSIDLRIMPGTTETFVIKVADITSYLPLGNIVIRLNDNGGDIFPYQPECDDTNNTVTITSPTIYSTMKKNAILYMSSDDSIVHNGHYGNPVSVLYGETIKYSITAVNTYATVDGMTIIDTLPAYLKYVAGSENVLQTGITNITFSQTIAGVQDVLKWVISGIQSMDTAFVTFHATPHSGACASQPLFANRACVIMKDEPIHTNYTYHQGAGASIVTFSAGFGGNLYNAQKQTLDYQTSLNSDILIVPDEGFHFVGWSHEAYHSMRGKPMAAQSCVMQYDTLIIYGNVELCANFALEQYDINYRLHGGINSANNPSAYTIKSGTITLTAPEKANDEFIGWTGSNGDEPQIAVSIPAHSTGERTYFANYLHSGCESNSDVKPVNRIWAAENELYIQTVNPGNIVRVYSLAGVLQRQQTIPQPGEAKIKLPDGLYVVTLNNDIGQIVRIK